MLMRRIVHKYFTKSILFCLVFYFAYYLVHGDRGVFKLYSLNGTMYNTKILLGATKIQHNKLSHKVSLLRSNSICADLLEERAKEVLGYANKNEKIVIDCLP